ncbi:MAG: hypothetical protein RLZZ350_2320 [Verrucomicrobiota bacterium]|jgi:hypothetical protein
MNMELTFTKRLGLDPHANGAKSAACHGCPDIQEIEMPEAGRNSMFRWPREAFENSYTNQIEFEYNHVANDGWPMTPKRPKESQLFFYRVRTVAENGKIVRAHYGKIKGGLQLAPSSSKTCKVKLTYYLNPTSLDRNMEFDPKQNLFTNLSADEEVRDP